MENTSVEPCILVSTHLPRWSIWHKKESLSQLQVCRPGSPLSLMHCMRGCDLPPNTLNSRQVKRQDQKVSPTLASLQLRITLQKAAAAFPMTVLASARSCLPASLEEVLCLLAKALFSAMDLV